MAGKLQDYEAKRDFEKTPEPKGAKRTRKDERPRFVIQQHDATRLHHDLRLEKDGVLVSFAIPRGLPWSPDTNHLAVHTEDHPLEYLDFHGEIPEGEYGAGTMTIWDRGTYEAEEFTDTKVKVVLHGERARGRYALFPTDGPEGRDWMIHRMDPPQDPDRRPVPAGWRPMEATPGNLPRKDEGWAYEIKWRGLRTLVAVEGGVVTMTAPRGEDVTRWFPEVRRLGRAVGYREVVLDGVLVAVDRQGRALDDHQRLQDRVAVESDSAIKRRSEMAPVALMVFDLLFDEGHPLVDEPYEERRRRLLDLDLAGTAWQTPVHHVGDGKAMLEAAAAQGLPGLVAKRLSSKYRPGTTTKDWVAVGAPA